VEYVRTLSKEFNVGSSAELRVENRSGTVFVHGEDTERARIEVVARLWAETDEEADDLAVLIERGIRQDGRKLSVRAPALVAPGIFVIFGRGPRIDYQITVPRATTGNVLNRSGRIEIEHLAGPVDIESRSGRVSVRNIKGNLTIVSRSGLVQADEIGGSVQIESRSGAVRVSDCKGSATIESRSGMTQVEDVGGALKVDSRSGLVRYEGAVKADVQISVTSGSVRMALERDSVFYLDAESAHGSVRSDMPLRRGGGGSPSGNGATVRVRTRSGSIHIQPR
jgi:DUF4097 and DUF4098 domain-containing protein YvlB